MSPPFQLVPDPASAPYESVYKFDGYIECSVTTVVLRFAACSVASSATGDNFLAEYTEKWSKVIRAAGIKAE